MALDVELYRRTLYAPAEATGQPPRRISAFDIHPDGAGHTLVLLHGFGGRALQWVYQMRHFGQTMRVIAPELRGHGHSADQGNAPITMANLVDDLEKVLAGLGVAAPFQLIAHSFGGAVAVEYALRHPDQVAGLVLIGLPARFILRRGARELMNVPAPVFGSVVRRLEIALYANIPTMRRLHDGAMAIWRGDERLPLVRVPTLVVLGHRDTVFAQDHYAIVPKLIPGTRQVTVPVSAHLVQLERPDAVNRAILRFIQPAPKSPEARVAPEAAALGQAAPISQALAKYAARPWLQHYDDGTPEELPLPRQPVHEMLSNAALENPDRAALIFFGQKIGYHELDQLTNRFAHALQRIGIQKGDRVAIVLPNVPQCVIAYYGCLKVGAVVVLGSPLTSPAEIANQLRDSGAAALVTLATYQKLVERLRTGALRHVIYTDVREYLPLPARLRLARSMDGSDPASLERAAIPPEEPAPAPRHERHALQPLLRAQPATALPSVTTSDDLAVIQYTSGTTDHPRGVMLTHANLIMNVTQMRHWIPDLKRGQESVLCVLPLSHSYGMTAGLNVAIGMSASIALLPTTRPRPIVEAIRRHHPSVFPGVPALYVAIANYPRIRSYGISSVRYCVSGSASLPVEVQEAFEKLTRGRLVEGYGLTEAAPGTHANPFKGERRIGSIGIPYPSTEARIVHPETGAPLPPGEVGELVIRGPQVMRGYWNLPDDTAYALRDGWLRTGDLARMDDDGFFSIVERKKNVILSGPYNIYPREVEEVLYEHPGVQEAVVVGEPAPGGDGTVRDAIVKAVVVLRRGEKATADELLALCRERLDAYKVPRQIEFRTELPKNFLGKVLRRLLVGTA